MTSTPTPEPTQPGRDGLSGIRRITDWLLSMLIIWFFSAIVYWLGVRSDSVRWGVRSALAALIGGLVVYILLGLVIPASLSWENPAGVFGLIVAELIGCLIGWGISFALHEKMVGSRSGKSKNRN